MSNLDVTMAKLAHLDWKSKLIDFIYGLADLKASDVSSHHECEFGKWLYSTGLKDFENLPIMAAIEREHKGVHDELKRIVLLPKEQREGDNGQKMIDDFKVKCDHLVGLLDELNSKI